MWGIYDVSDGGLFGGWVSDIDYVGGWYWVCDFDVRYFVV